MREFEYAGQYISYNGKTVEEDVFDESVTLSRGEYCLIYTTTLNKPVMYTVKPASPDDTGYIDIESIINEEYDTWSALEKRLSNRVEKAEEDLTTASDYFKEGYNSANAPSDAEEAFDAWSDYVSGSFIPIINYTPVILICGFAFFFSVMVLSVVFNAVYAVGDKDLRNRTFAVRDKLVLVKGEKAGEEFIGTLKKYSKKDIQLKKMDGAFFLFGGEIKELKSLVNLENELKVFERVVI